MKPKEFITKYHLERGWNSRVQKPFLQDFTNELIAFLEFFNAQNNIRGFDNAVKVIRSKWDAVSRKIPYGLPDKLWSYFWATVVCKLREELCPVEVKRMEARKAEWERRQAEREEMDNRWKEEYERGGDMFFSSTGKSIGREIESGKIIEGNILFAKIINASICICGAILIMIAAYNQWSMYGEYTVFSFLCSLFLHGGFMFMIYLGINWVIDRLFNKDNE